MKHYRLFIVGLLLAIGCLLLGLQLGKSKLYQAELSQGQTDISQSTPPLPSVLDSSASDSDSAQLITELENEVQQLKQALAEKTELIDSMNSSMGLLEQQVEIAYTEIDAASKQVHDSPFHPEPSSITAEQASQWVPVPFATMVANQQGDMIELFKRHHQADTNQEWATKREQALSDVMTNSDYASEVNIESIMCKATTCEIRGEELSANAWVQVSQQLQGSELGKNVSTWSYLVSDADGRTLIYMLSEIDESQVINTDSQ